MPQPVLPDGFDAYLDAWEAKIGAFIEFRRDAALSIDPSSAAAAGLSGAPLEVAGLPFAVKDNIAVEGFGLSCGSKLLAGLESPYTATAVSRLQAAGAVVVGKTNLDEFGMGSSCDLSALKRTNNPWNPERVAGGSSGGSAAAVAAGLVPFALGSASWPMRPAWRR
jgi:aspartyl-tRNA(Asn)/glutamyl-tRNA(Gln) amidotransferase subunit A